MGIRIEIDTLNAAFQDSAPGSELASILRSVAHRIAVDGGATDRAIVDTNGNIVGYLTTGIVREGP